VELQLGSSSKEKTVILGRVAAAEIDTVALRLGSRKEERDAAVLQLGGSSRGDTVALQQVQQQVENTSGAAGGSVAEKMQAGVNTRR
jgi:hypothetical protein